MNAIELICDRMAGWAPKPALYWDGRTFSYEDFLGRVAEWRRIFDDHGIVAGSVVALRGDYSPGTISLMFALMRTGAIIVPFTPSLDPDIAKFSAIAGVEHLVRFAEDDTWEIEPGTPTETNELIGRFRETGASGLIVFSSGSSGQPKGILHDCERVMRKFAMPRAAHRTVLFLMMDHFGGFNTMLGAVAYGGVAVCPNRRLPKDVAVLIENSGADLLPTTPTFLNLLLASDVWRDHDLSSIRVITYGTEVMPESTQARLAEVFPNCTLKQTYGLSELGVLRSKSRDQKSTWVKVGGSGFDVKVVDGQLWVKAESNMIGYLNAPDPFDADGWMCTGDRVEVDGDYLRFLGRDSDMINVGGQKVFPAEVENVLLQAPNVKDATVTGQKHPLLGQAVIAWITPYEPENPEDLSRRLRQFCHDHLNRYKVPMRFSLVEDGSLAGNRFKKARRQTPPAP